jgi:hypothetical protein
MLSVSAATVEAFSVGAENCIVVVTSLVALVALVGAGVGARSSRGPRPPNATRVLRWAGVGLLSAFIRYSVRLVLLAR